jgi:Zn-dependent peptidase ImmA (M78 family)
MTASDEMLARVQARVDRALARATLPPGTTFDDVVRAVEHAIGIRLTVVAEADTAMWGTLTGFLAYFPERREGTIHVRAADATVYREFAASHELGHLLDDAHCCGAVHQRSSVSPHANPALSACEIEAELVAEHIAHAIARLMYASPRVEELSW